MLRLYLIAFILGLVAAAQSAAAQSTEAEDPNEVVGQDWATNTEDTATEDEDTEDTATEDEDAENEDVKEDSSEPATNNQADVDISFPEEFEPAAQPSVNDVPADSQQNETGHPEIEEPDFGNILAPIERQKDKDDQQVTDLPLHKRDEEIKSIKSTDKSAIEQSENKAAENKAAKTTTATTLDLPLKIPWTLTGIITYSGRIINDASQSGAYHRMLRYNLSGNFEVIPKASVFIFTGLEQFFIDDPNESGLILEDTILGALYQHDLPINGTSIVWLDGKQLKLKQQFRLYLPTSPGGAVYGHSYHDGFILGPQLRTEGMLEVMAKLNVGYEMRGRYLFYKYAEQNGQKGGMNPQWEFYARLFVLYDLYDFGVYGTMQLGADVSSGWVRCYASRENYKSPVSAQALWVQDYDWTVSVTYSPIAQFNVAMVIEQYGLVRDDGTINTPLVKREETELKLMLTAIY
ncbi:MAG: hypothetical protein JW841_17830 [Deltaproteobacteria bacterium]|nr:hypothetical protein [Deltaproteobacteria bacterium]